MSPARAELPELPFNPFANSRYICPVVDPDNVLPVWRAVHIVGIYRCVCSDNCGCTSDLVAVKVTGTNTAAFRFPFSQLVKFDEELVCKPVLVR